MSLLRLRNASLALVALGLSTSAFAQKNDLGLEAIVAPVMTKTFGSDPYSRFGIEFFRVSSGGSLQVLYGKRTASDGSSYSDYAVAFRLSGLKQFFDEPFSRGLIYGLGLGITNTSGIPKELTNTSEKAAYADLFVNPYVRYLFDINGWVGPYLELGYEITATRFKMKKSVAPLEAPSEGRFVLGFGLAFEAER
ncbi:MAG: hypothetical protein ABIR96_06335 [Bdellovibrionota bacterium]